MLSSSTAKTTLLAGAIAVSASHYSQQGFVASVWGEVSFAVWCAVLFLSPVLPGVWCRRHIAWGLLSIGILEYFVLVVDPDFKGWGDVYYFCGSRLQHCTCNFRWNLSGWVKALVLWNFVLSSALGLQKLLAQLGLDGLLPGEEVVTKDSFISIIWRLIPYWLNNWEQQWGSECTSMMFELPHFALELLVVLPCIQIVCGRLRILALAPGQALGQLPDHPAQDPRLRAHLAPDVLRGTWSVDARQALFMPRLRANLKVLAMVVGIAFLAGYNALRIPLSLEAQITAHAQTGPMLAFGSAWGRPVNGSFSEPGSLPSEPHQDASMLVPLVLSGREVLVNSSQAALREAYAAHGCPTEQPLFRMMAKHADEIIKMQAAEHKMLIPLVEVALGIMRLSCERFFVSPPSCSPTSSSATTSHLWQNASSV
ncbi:hypothetical protein WJX84_002650 [Apatococcus fuscideae]|uniref:Uncharacterized protein n=1 Tax=Apatococcus fuscideae TaxID=2026836 RepID=A0AAW1STP0_9CHLO